MHHDHKHMIDILFVLSLFCVFAVSAVVVILFGANIYRSTVSHMDHNYTQRTSIAYITEKIRQSDESGALQLRTENNTPVLMLTSVINDIPYATSLYEFNGWLYELFARTDIELPLDAGQPVMEVSSLSFKEISPSLLSVSITDSTGEAETIYVSIHSDSEAAHE